MTNQIAVSNTQNQVADLNQIHQIGEFGLNELMAMKESIAKKLSIPQFNLFMYQANRMKLDPSLGHCVPILYGQDVNVRIEYEGFKALAQDSNGYNGIYPQVVRENDDFSAESGEDGVITKVDFKMGKMPRGRVVGSFAVAKREGFKDFIVVCELDEFEKYAKKNPSFWKLESGGIDPDMAKKFAATRAVKGQFNIADVVENNGLDVSTPEPYTPQRRDITGESELARPQVTQLQQPTTSEKPKTTTPTDAPKEDFTDRWLQVGDLLVQLGYKTKPAKSEYINANFKTKGSIPTHEDFNKFIKLIEMEIAESSNGDDLE